MNPDEFHNKIVKHENKAQGKYHAEFVEDVLQGLRFHMEQNIIVDWLY